MNRHFMIPCMVLVATVMIAYAQHQEYPEQLLVVTGTISGGAAEDVGIAAGDVIIAYDGQQVNSHSGLATLVKSNEKESVEITVMRDDEIRHFTIPSGFIGVYVKEVLPDILFDADAVIIEGIDQLSWERGEANSFIGALTRIAEYLHIPKDYNYLMGASGAAFRLHFHESWCPSSPDITVGRDCGTQATQSINLAAQYMVVEEGKVDKAMRTAITETLDDGMPVIAIDLIDVPEWGIVVGYQKQGNELIVRTYFDRRNGYEIAEKFPWVIVLLSGERIEVDDCMNFRTALALAQEMYETEKYDAYYSGIAALEYWIELLKMDDFTKYDDEKITEVILANAWIYERLAGDRKCGAYYLRSHAGHFPDAASPVMELARLYEEIHEIMTNVGESVPYPDFLETRDDWTEKMREKEIEVLTEVLAKEKQACVLIKEINTQLQ